MTWVLENFWLACWGIFALLLIRSTYKLGRLGDEHHILKSAVYRAEHGFNRIKRCASSGQVVDKDVREQARCYAREMKEVTDSL